MQKSQYVIANNKTNKMNHYKIEEEDKSQKTKYITWLENVNDNQGLILQLVSENERKKLKKKIKTCYNVKKQTNLMVLKLIVQKKAGENHRWKSRK